MPDDRPRTDSYLDADRLVPVRAERYEVLTELFRAALEEHLDILARDAHGSPGCPLCTVLRRIIRGVAMAAGERAYLDEMHPPAGTAGPAHDGAEGVGAP